MSTAPFSIPYFTMASDAIPERPPATGERALVLGGGGSAGNAWKIGVIAGLYDAGLDVTEADLIIGTSAGSTAAAQVSSETQPDELLAGILTPRPSRDRSGRIRRWTRSGQASGGPSGEDDRNHRCR